MRLIFSGIAKERWLNGLVDAAAIGLGGALLSAAYIVPALRLKTETLPFDAWVTASGSNFKAVNWLIGVDNRLGFFVYIILGLVTALALLFLILARLNPLSSNKPVLTASSVTMIICWLMMTELTYGLWNNIDVLAQVQFPWRLGVLIDFTAVVIMLFAYNAMQESKARKANVVLLISLTVITALSVTFRFPRTVISKDAARTVSERQALEYRPKWLVESELYLNGNSVQDFRDINRARDLHNQGFEIWKAQLVDKALLSERTAIATFDSSQREMQLLLNVDVKQPGTLVLKKVFYPHWILSRSPTGEIITLEPDPVTGLIQFSLPQGKHSLVLQKQMLPIEKTGYFLSLLGVVLLGGMFFFGRKVS